MVRLFDVVKTKKKKQKYLIYYGTLPFLLTACLQWKKDPEPEPKAEPVKEPEPAPTPTSNPVAPQTPTARPIATENADVIQLDGTLLDVDALGGDDKILGSAAAETIKGGDGADLIRGGKGIDKIYGGAGVDHIVLVGANTNGSYTIEDITNPNGTGIDLTSVVKLADVNEATSDAEAGEVIDGGADGAMLFIFGEVDLSEITIQNVTQIQVQSTLTITAAQIQALQAQGLTKIIGDGTTEIIILDSETPIEISLASLEISHLELLSVGKNVTLILDKEDIENIHQIEGLGVVQSSSGVLDIDDMPYKMTNQIINEDDEAQTSLKITKTTEDGRFAPLQVYEAKEGETVSYDVYWAHHNLVYLDNAYQDGLDSSLDNTSNALISGANEFKTIFKFANQITTGKVGYFKKATFSDTDYQNLEIDAGSDYGDFAFYAVVATISKEGEADRKVSQAEFRMEGSHLNGNQHDNELEVAYENNYFYHFVDGKDGNNILELPWNAADTKYFLLNGELVVYKTHIHNDSSVNNRVYIIRNIDEIEYADQSHSLYDIAFKLVQNPELNLKELKYWLPHYDKANFSDEDHLLEGQNYSAERDVKSLSSHGGEIIKTGAGNDEITLKASFTNGIIHAGSGNDIFNAGNGAGADSLLIGGSGDDIFNLTSRDTRVWGGDGYDKVVLSSESDALQNHNIVLKWHVDGASASLSQVRYFEIEDFTLTSYMDFFAGNDQKQIVDLRQGNDKYYASIGGDQVDGGAGFDSLYFNVPDLIKEAVTLDFRDQTNNAGAAEASSYINFETVHLSVFSDVVYLSSDSPEDILGEGGDDIFYDRSGAWESRFAFFGGEERDKVSYLHAGDQGVTINLANLSNNAGAAVGDTYTSIEIFEGTNQSDSMAANNLAVEFLGMGGDDTLTGGSGNDILDGGIGNDFIVGGFGDDRVYVSSGSDTLHGDFGGLNSGIDWLDFSRTEQGFTVNFSMAANATSFSLNSQTFYHFEKIQGSDRNDIMTTNETIQEARGGKGDDTISGINNLNYNDKFYGEAGNDTLRGYFGNDELYGGDGNDTFEGLADQDVWHGGAGRDQALLPWDYSISINKDQSKIIFAYVNRSWSAELLEVETVMIENSSNNIVDLYNIFDDLSAFNQNKFNDETDFQNWLVNDYGYELA